MGPKLAFFKKKVSNYYVQQQQKKEIKIKSFTKEMLPMQMTAP